MALWAIGRLGHICLLGEGGAGWAICADLGFYPHIVVWVHHLKSKTQVGYKLSGLCGIQVFGLKVVGRVPENIKPDCEA